MGLLLNRAKAGTTTTGTGATTPGSAVAPYRSWSAAGAAAGFWYDYLIEDGTAWELGCGLYNGTTLTRPGPGVDPQFESSTGSLLSLSGGATVACVANRNTLAAGGKFMPPMASYFPSHVFGTGTPTLTNDAAAGLVMDTAPTSGDKSNVFYKAIGAAGDWQVVAKFKTTAAPPNGGGTVGTAIYVGNSSGKWCYFSLPFLNTTQYIYVLTVPFAGTSGASGVSFVTTVTRPEWMKVVFTNSSSTLEFFISYDGENWLSFYSNTYSGLSLGGKPNCLGMGMSANSGSFARAACSYWWDNA